MTLAIAHRGASAYKPENTIAAFQAAVEFGANGIELDVHGTADGVVVVHHDPTVHGIPIADVSYDDLMNRLRSTDEVAMPPTLRDALDVIGPDTIVYIEVKSLSPDHDHLLMRVIAGAPNPAHCEVHGFDHRIVQRLVLAQTGLRGGVLSASYPINPVAQVVDAHAHTLWQRGTLIDEAMVQQIHAAQMKIIAWTVDDEQHMQFLQRIGVDGVCSNVPDIATRVLR